MLTRSFLVAISALIAMWAGKSVAFSGLRAHSPKKLMKVLPKSSPPFQLKPNQNGVNVALKALTPPDSDKTGIFKPKNVKLAVIKFLDLLWTGMMFPFPVLQGLANESTESSGFTLSESLVAIVGYLGTGVVAYSVVFEKWSVVDALYFSVVSFTTVGYGDLYPSNAASKLFTCFYGLGGIVLLGAVIATIGKRLVKAEIDAIESAERASRRRLMNVLDAMPTVLANNASLPRIFKLKQEPKDVEEPVTRPSWKKYVTEKMMPTVNSIISASSVLFIGGLIMGRLEGWKWRDSIYYSLVTAGTLGFGDFAPHTVAGRIWAIAFIPLAVAAAGEVLGSVASFLIERRNRETYDRILHRELTMEYLLQMDTNGDGKVTREEFIQGMLVELKLVDVNQLKELNEQFDRLDISQNGTLEKDDLKLVSQVNGITLFSEKS